jgi:glycosyltransferase involved in cell wall biosynthesis
VSLRKLLRSCREAKFDEIVIVETNGGDPQVERAAKAFGAKYFTWEDPDKAQFTKFCEDRGLGTPEHFSDFAAARNYAFSKCEGDWICWLDSDDALVNGKNIRAWVERAMREDKDTLQAYYAYSHDKAGNVTMEQYRERIVKRGAGEWFPFLHELYLNKQKGLDALAVPKEAFHVIHSAIDEEIDRNQHDLRNARILLFHYEKQGQKLESRMWKMLGNACRGLGKYFDAIQAYEEHLNSSSWDMDHYFALYQSAFCYRAMNMPEEASAYDMRAVKIAPQYPQAWAGLAASELLSRRWKQALTFAEIGLAQYEIDPQGTMLVENNPTGLKKVLYYAQYRCLFEMGRHEDSLTPLGKLLKLFPKNEEYMRLWKITEVCLKQAELGKAQAMVLESLNQEESEEKIHAALKAIPKEVLDLAPYQHLKRLEPDRSKVSIAIACNNKLVRFGPSSLKEGVGGSEEAVIHMAEALALEGAWVDVFADTFEEGEHGNDGAKYRWYQSGSLRKSHVYDHVIAWRVGDMVAGSRYAARNNVVWMHDVGRMDQWSESAIENVDKVIVLSKYHRSTLPWIPEEKIIYSRNGIHPSWLAEPKNDPKKVIYASNPTRGLKTLLQMWPDVHATTGAELHLFYGFTEWHRRLVADNPYEQRYMVEIKQLFDQVKKYKVFDHGMVGHKELAEWMAQCGVAAAPTEFPEISMITAMKYQAMGCVPVITDYAAISETVQYGNKIPWKEGEPYPVARFKEKLIYLIHNEVAQAKIRAEMVPWARQAYEWQPVARQWIAELEGFSCKDLKETLPQTNSLVTT